jgi:type IV secretory pathway TrbL component
MEVVIVLGAIAVSFLVFTWMLRVAKATIKTAFLVAIILLALQLLFGIGPEALWEEVSGWFSGTQPPR